MLPAMQLEGPAAFLASDTGWLLMAVAQTGAMRVWDLQVRLLCLLQTLQCETCNVVQCMHQVKKWPDRRITYNPSVSSVTVQDLIGKSACSFILMYVICQEHKWGAWGRHYLFRVC